ncbi:hypothetical protein CEXT_783981, partial [Caerostris extrusa]
MEEEMEDFPRHACAVAVQHHEGFGQRAELDDKYLELELEAEKDLAKNGLMLSSGNFCDLDSQILFDRSVSATNSSPSKSPLLAMEHCIAPFLDSAMLTTTTSFTEGVRGIVPGVER